ncbi:uncharacterized protein LOC123552306 [Mercenaria mercenaria]|uniref:uncharacterized protein LOC123552306 n=1 Tax=Mercenaria mercenaria TaxID=6596 RepID=UPI00234FA2DD|nr:uncharacterized protein LOC123552306 [Mercenaria mercenaria]
MFYRIFIPLFANAQLLVLVGAQYFTETCVETSHRKKSTQLDCTDGIISDVSVTSGLGRCLNDAGRCLGMTPTVMVDSMNCYWNSDCLIKWPRDPIIYTETDRTCMGRVPTFMSISYKCFKPTDNQEENGFVNDVQPKKLLIDMCSDDVEESVYKRTGDSKMAGIIRSHKLYPWDYSNSRRTCSVNIYWRSKQKQKLVVTVKGIDLSENDSLTIRNEKREAVNVTSERTFIFSDGTVTSFVFSVGWQSNSGKGFLLCFRFISDVDKTVKDDACESIMTAGIVNNVEPDDQGSPPFHLATTTTSTITTPEITTTLPIPKRCLRKKTEKKRLKCAKRNRNKGRTGKKNRPGRRDRRKKGKKDRRKRRHSNRRHN